MIANLSCSMLVDYRINSILQPAIIFAHPVQLVWCRYYNMLLKSIVLRVELSCTVMGCGYLEKYWNKQANNSIRSQEIRPHSITVQETWKPQSRNVKNRKVSSGTGKLSNITLSQLNALKKYRNKRDTFPALWLDECVFPVLWLARLFLYFLKAVYKKV